MRKTLRQYAPQVLLAIGAILLLIGYVQQGAAFRFDSGISAVGTILTLSGLTTYLLGRAV